MGKCRGPHRAEGKVYAQGEGQRHPHGESWQGLEETFDPQKLNTVFNAK